MFNKCLSENFHIEVMWNNSVEPDSPQMTIRRMRSAYWILKATNTHSNF